MAILDFFRDTVTKAAELIVEQKYPKLRIYGDNPLINVKNDYGEFDEAHHVDFLTRMGNAALVAGCALDVPTVHIFKQRRSFTFKEIANTKSWCDRDLRKMQATGNISSVNDHVALMRESLITAADKSALYGLPAANLYGLLSQPHAVQLVLPADGALNNSGQGVNSVRFVDKTDAQVLRDMITISQYIRSLSNEVDYIDTLLVTPEFLDRISNTVAIGITTGTTIIDFFLTAQLKNPYGIRRILALPHLKGEGSLPSSDLLVGYNSQSNSIKFHEKAGVGSREYQHDLDYCLVMDKSFGSTVAEQTLEIMYTTC